MEQIRTLPLRVAPADGESLHSWLLRLALRNGIPLLRLAAVLGLRDRLKVPHNYALSWRIPAELLRRIENQTGLPPGRLDAAMLDPFDMLGWKPLPGSRYCTTCLKESGGIWQVRWQLPYSFACRKHGKLLTAVCPGCGRAPHGTDCPCVLVSHPQPPASWAREEKHGHATPTCSATPHTCCTTTTSA
ncbi:MAG TPA: hypothetical protein DGG94_03095 [Micromonosporaceae bacterium]|nr:hypothetical protein [Micromonosporaceae bacterium]HCU48802.1 hypothetical protein [Micromonosporaceae bacterium]